MYKKQKQEIIDISNEMIKRGLSKLTGGNISVYIPEDNVMLITPGSTPYDSMQIEDIVEMDLDGNVLNQKQLDKRGRFKSSEWEMHTAGYLTRKDARAFIHCHPIYAMSVGAVVDKLPAIDYLIAHTRSYEVPVAPYETYGSPEIAKASAKVLKNCDAVLLENHGLNTVGSTLPKALKIASVVEFLSQMYMQALSIGKPKIIPKHKMQEVLYKFHGKVDKYK